MAKQQSNPAPGLRSKLVLSRKPRTKRDPLELSLLALLDTCIEWPDDDISERKIHASDLLKICRGRHGLEDVPSVATVHNHLHALAEMCDVPALFATGEKRQHSRLPEENKRLLIDARAKLAATCASSTQG